MARASHLPPSPSSPGTFHYLPPLPVPPSSADEQNARTLHSHFHHYHHHRDQDHQQNSHSQAPQRQQQQQQRHMYPTSSPFHRYDISPDPSPTSAIRLPPITSSFTNGYASPAASSHSSDPPSRDELDVVMGDPNSSSGMSTNDNNNTDFHVQHVSLPGVDGMLSRGNGMILDSTTSPRRENRDWESRERWNMRHFTLIQTVGTQPRFTFAAPPSSRHGAYDLLPFRHGDIWTSLPCPFLDTSTQ